MRSTWGEGLQCRCPHAQPMFQHRSVAALQRAANLRTSTITNVAAPVQQRAVAQSTPNTTQVSIHYRTGWSQAVLHGSVCGGPWKDYPLQPVPTAPGKWARASFQFPISAAQPQLGLLLEFVLTNKKDDWDKPIDGTNYGIQTPGNYIISGGQVNKASGKRVMVVSDLDGTMVGDDAATSAFKQWWEDTSIPRGSILVYNTGRSLESFLALMKEKSRCLAAPNALISAVGTKIYEFTGAKWQEDQMWVAQLDDGWNLEGAQEACYRALAEVGKERMHFRPPEEQNSHKVTCGVQRTVLQPVLDVVEGNLAGQGVQANIITSGHGEWRYMDIVPKRAGKLSALNWVRKRHGFSPQETVACGDSGNDILMLQGENPAIVVGNAQQDLKDWYQSRKEYEPRGNGPEGKQRLLMVKKHEAQGILEGLAHWGFK